jgi:Fic family protein
MNYIELPKLYYKNNDMYVSEYKNRFDSPDAIKLDFQIKSNQAFFLPNAEVSGIVFQILKLDKEISLLSSRLPGIALEQFKNKCLIDEIILTNKIEGVYSTRREIASILNDLESVVGEKAVRKRFWGLVRQYSKLKTNKHVCLKSCEDVRQLYDELVLAEVIEENPNNAPDGKIFRKDSASVNTSTDREIHRGTYPESAICEGMEKSLGFLCNENIELLYRISVFHYLLEYIHPFYDGNGRLGRYIISDLISQELNPLFAYRISYTIAENINLYYDAFKTCNDTLNLGDVTPFLIMMLNMIKTSAIKLEDALRERCIRLDRYQKLIKNLPSRIKGKTSGAYNILIQAGLFSENGVSTKMFTKHLESSYSTAKKELDFIESCGLLIRNRVGKENLYLLDLDELDAILFRIDLIDSVLT